MPLLIRLLRLLPPLFICFCPLSSFARETAMEDFRNTKRRRIVAEQLPCCSHPVTFEGFCVICFRQLQDDDDDKGSGPSTVRLDYVFHGLKVKQATMDTLRQKGLERLIAEKKLVLVLDLDHTLLQSIDDHQEMQRHRGLIHVESVGKVMKLRPFVHTFLEQASCMFDTYVYTMGERKYALEIARLLDPDGKFLDKSQVIAREDCTTHRRKGLDIVPADERVVVILDDKLSVWKRHARNLIRIQRYDYFPSSGFRYQSSLMEMGADEKESDGPLACILDLLRRVHQAVFHPTLGVDLTTRDVPRVLKRMRQEILQGCKILLTKVYAAEVQAKVDPVWKMAEKMGARCTVEGDESVTHVVSMWIGTPNSHWAVWHGKFLVTPDWIEAAYHLWRRPLERDYVLTCAAGVPAVPIAPPPPPPPPPPPVTQPALSVLF